MTLADTLLFIVFELGSEWKDPTDEITNCRNGRQSRLSGIRKTVHWRRVICSRAIQALMCSRDCMLPGLQLYSFVFMEPGKTFFDKTWKLDDIEKINDLATAQSIYDTL